MEALTRFRGGTRNGGRHRESRAAQVQERLEVMGSHVATTSRSRRGGADWRADSHRAGLRLGGTRRPAVEFKVGELRPIEEIRACQRLAGLVAIKPRDGDDRIDRSELDHVGHKRDIRKPPRESEGYDYLVRAIREEGRVRTQIVGAAYPRGGTSIAVPKRSATR